MIKECVIACKEEGVVYPNWRYSGLGSYGEKARDRAKTRAEEGRLGLEIVATWYSSFIYSPFEKHLR